MILFNSICYYCCCCCCCFCCYLSDYHYKIIEIPEFQPRELEIEKLENRPDRLQRLLDLRDELEGLSDPVDLRHLGGSDKMITISTHSILLKVINMNNDLLKSKHNVDESKVLKDLPSLVVVDYSVIEIIKEDVTRKLADFAERKTNITKRASHDLSPIV